MSYYFKIYKSFFFQYIKSLMQSKLNFFIGLIGCLFVQASGIVFLYLIFEKIPLLNGWNRDEIVFIYGLSQIPKGLDHLFADYIWLLSSRMLTNGEFDRYLLRPIPPFFQLICERVQFDALGEIIIGLFLVIVQIKKGTVMFSIIGMFWCIIAIAAGTIIYTSVKLFFASLAFWVMNSAPILQLSYEISNFTKYPISIYPTIIQFISSFVVPFAFASFYPATYFLRNTSVFKTIIAEVLVASVSLIIANTVFKKGIKVYKSAGN